MIGTETEEGGDGHTLAKPAPEQPPLPPPVPPPRPLTNPGVYPAPSPVHQRMASQYNSTYSIHRQYRRYQIGKKKKLLLLPIISFVNSTVIIRAPLIVLQYRVCKGEGLKKDWRGVSQPLNLPVSRDSVTIF